MYFVLPVLGLTFLGSIVALSGGVVFLYNKKWSVTLERHSVPFAAGVLITVSLLGLIPESADALGEQAFSVVLLSFLGAYLFENFVFGLHHHDKPCRAHEHQSSTTLIIIGDTIHNFVDGVTIAATYMISPGLGVITTLSTLLHEVPHEISDFGILLKSGWKKNKVLMVNVISALFAFPGAIFVLFISNNQYFIGVLLALAAGLFLYLGASDFLPHIDHNKSKKYHPVAALLVGVALMYTTFQIIPHSSPEGKTTQELPVPNQQEVNLNTR